MAMPYQKLQAREKNGNPVRVALAGFGFIGRGALMQSLLMKGLCVSAIYGRNTDRILNLFPVEAGIPAVCRSLSEYTATEKAGGIALTDDVDLLCELPVDVIVEVTGDAFFAAALAEKAIQAGKHFVASPELDICVGPYLSELARQHGVVYSGQDGDEPGVLMPLFEYVATLGFDIIAAGKFKNYSNRHANPETVKPWATSYGQDPYKIASFADCTKMNMEMGTVCNATGFVPDARGMHNPTGTLETVTDIIRLKEDGGILAKRGVIEIVQGVHPLGGVYVVAKCEHPRMMSDLKYYKMGDGPYYLFYRPYHLASVEILLGAADVVVNGAACICPRPMEAIVDVAAFAKRDLQPGMKLDSIGGFDYYGLLDECTNYDREDALPVTLAKDAVIKRKVREDDLIFMSDVDVDKDKPVWRMREALLKHRIAATNGGKA